MPHRFRHVKCDETPGACRNCTSTGRKCEGYDQYRLPMRWSSTPRTSRNLAISLPGMTSDERRCFRFFGHHTVSMMVGYAESEVWQQLVLQMSQSEPAICHAVVALSAIHQEYEGKGMTVKPDHRAHRFALEQYGRAMSRLCSRIQSNDPQVREITLMCCIIFVVLELLEGEYKNAFAHLRQGLGILDAHSGHTSATERSLAQAFLHLNVLRSHYGHSDVSITIHPPQGSVAEVVYERVKIRSLSEAKERMLVLMNNIFHFQSRCYVLFRGDLATDIFSLSAQQGRLQCQLDDYRADLEAFVSIHSTRHAWTLREIRSVDLIQLHLETLVSLLGGSLDTTEMGFDRYLPEFKRMNEFCERIISSFRREYKETSRLPSMIMDMGFLPALFWSCVKCRDPETRRHAEQLLQVWPHREGIYDSHLVSLICEAIIAIESEGQDEAGFIPQSARVQTQIVEFAEDRSHIVMKYTLAGSGAWGTDERERVIPFEGREAPA
ncbi:Zn(II)2Cys6 transcription factor [Aspergillus ibericus CBS 121593]|uniref:Zn(2)-C6 fungal-type domain-containing protein n=1 Tax=Aspergillus ibericus CBS 121593 TaxID=1448316 RepID=A0A395GNJ8_9EURO|nr:hypothetical protein BO80DRAFT_468120 [Aspergillus ibericus CBS 121593]RAK97059.1 hypothetical protein BO80DRAFT_468120 [Aspergillus ibericus CBS 121593]